MYYPEGIGAGMVNCVLYGHEKKVLEEGGVVELKKKVIA
jgi:hypothetical protein